MVLNGAQEPQIWPNIDGYKSSFSYTLQAQAMAVFPIGQRTSILGGVSAVIEPQSYTNADAAALEGYHCIRLKFSIQYSVSVNPLSGLSPRQGLRFPGLNKQGNDRHYRSDNPGVLYVLSP